MQEALRGHYYDKAQTFIINNLEIIHHNINLEIKKPLNQINWQNLFKVPSYKDYLQLLQAISQRKEHNIQVHYELMDAFICHCIIKNSKIHDAEKIYSNDLYLIYKLILVFPSCYSTPSISKGASRDSNNELLKCFYDSNISSSSEQLSANILNYKIKKLQSFIERRIAHHDKIYIWKLYQMCFKNLQPEENNQDGDKQRKVDEIKVAGIFQRNEIKVVDIILNLITDGKISEPSTNNLDFEDVDEEFLFLKFMGNPLKPDFLLSYNKAPVIVGDFKVARNSGCKFGKKAFLKQILTYLLSSNLQNFFITNGSSTVFYFLSRHTTVCEIQGNKGPKFEVKLNYIKIENFDTTKRPGRDTNSKLTNRLMIASLAAENYLKLQAGSKRSNQRPLNTNICNVLNKVRRPQGEIDDMVSRMRNQCYINNIYNFISKLRKLTNLPQDQEKELNILNSFNYEVKSVTERSIVLNTEIGELAKDSPNLLPKFYLPNSKKVVLKIYDYIK